MRHSPCTDIHAVSVGLHFISSVTVAISILGPVANGCVVETRNWPSGGSSHAQAHRMPGAKCVHLLAHVTPLLNR